MEHKIKDIIITNGVPTAVTFCGTELWKRTDCNDFIINGIVTDLTGKYGKCKGCYK